MDSLPGVTLPLACYQHELAEYILLSYSSTLIYGYRSVIVDFILAKMKARPSQHFAICENPIWKSLAKRRWAKQMYFNGQSTLEAINTRSNFTYEFEGNFREKWNYLL